MLIWVQIDDVDEVDFLPDCFHQHCAEAFAQSL
jgi:hypothetical protein